MQALAQASVTLAAPIRRTRRLITGTKMLYEPSHFPSLPIPRPFVRSFVHFIRFAKRAPEVRRDA